MSGADMERKFKVGKGIVTNYMKKNGLQVSKKYVHKFRSEARKRKFDPNSKENKYIKKNYLKFPLKRLSVMMGRTETFVAFRLKRLGLKVPAHIIEQRKRDSQIKPGNVPANKGLKQKDFMSKEAIAKTIGTRFKKGNVPASSIGFNNGDISLRHNHANDNGGRVYKYIRIALGKWYPLHQHKWEQKNGKLPAGHCLWFKDGDTMNCRLTNLELITRAENMRRNSCSIRLTDGYIAQTIVGKNGSRELFQEVLKDKKLIAAKRYQLLLRRSIKQYDIKGN